MQILDHQKNRFSFKSVASTHEQHKERSTFPLSGEFFEETNASVQIWRRRGRGRSSFRLFLFRRRRRRRVSQEKTSSERGHARKNNNKSGEGGGGGGDETWVRLDA